VYIHCAVLFLTLTAVSCPVTGAEDIPAPKKSTAEPDYTAAVSQLKKVVGDELRRGIIPGVSIALVESQQTVMAEGFGLADKARRIPATEKTVYRVGSISKLFNALAAMQLAEQGKLDIDAPIMECLPDFRIVNPFGNAAPITLRQLMCHRSGMVRESPVGGYLDGSEPSVAASIASLESCVLVNPPDTKTRYSNIGATLVGHAVAAVAGQPFEQYQQEHLLGPLGMTDSAWRMNGDLREQLATSYMRVADGRGEFVEREAPQFELGTIPAGNLYSTASDMAHFARMLLAEGSVDGRQLIQAATLQQMFTPQWTGADSGFGLGFAVGYFAGYRSIHHTGAVYGFSSSIVVLPDPGIAVVVLVNEDIATGPVRRLSDAALELMLQAKTGREPTAPATPVQLEPDRLAAPAGQYESPGYWAEITLVDGRLEADISGQPMVLTPVGPLTFEANGRFVDRSTIEFQQDEEGHLIGFSALGQQFAKVRPSGEPEIPGLWRRFLGSYGPDFIPLVVSARHGHLYAMTENMLDYRLTPVNQTVFKMSEGLYADEYLVFQLGEDGTVRSVNLANMELKRQPQRSESP
jgi:serine beta-lactamase-like protein LACTB